MPATRTTTTLSAPISQSNLCTALQSVFSTAGLGNPIDDFTSGTDRILIFAKTTGTGTFGTIYLRLRITSGLRVFQQLFTTWNSSTNSGTRPISEHEYDTLSSDIDIKFDIFNREPEYWLILVSQSSKFLPLGMVAPSIKRSNFSFNSFAWGFIFTSKNMTNVRGSPGYYSSDNYELSLAGSGRLSNADPIDNERDVITGIMLLSQSNQGIAGKFSDDLAVIAAAGTSRYDNVLISGTSEQYLIIAPGPGGIGVRIL